MFLIQTQRAGRRVHVQYVTGIKNGVPQYGPKSKAQRFGLQQAHVTTQWCNENRATQHQVIEEGEAK